MLLSQMFVLAEGSGGLFDFNATLPVMAVQIVLLMIVLTFVFYKPVGNLINSRQAYINTSSAEASEKLLKADELFKQYDEQVAEARAKAQTEYETVQAATQAQVTQEVEQSRKDSDGIIAHAREEIKADKALVLQKLEPYIDDLSELIKEKLLGKQVVL